MPAGEMTPLEFWAVDSFSLPLSEEETDQQLVSSIVFTLLLFL